MSLKIMLNINLSNSLKETTVSSELPVDRIEGLDRKDGLDKIDGLDVMQGIGLCSDVAKFSLNLVILFKHFLTHS